MMKSMKSMKRMALTGAAVTVMVAGLAAPAMALPGHDASPVLPPGQILPPDPTPPDPPPVPYCVKHPNICNAVFPPGQIAPSDPTPDNPNPGDPTPADPNPPANTNEGGGSNALSADDSGSYEAGSLSETFDRGGLFISSLLPNTFTSMVGDTGNSVKDNLPNSIAKNVPNTGGGWSFLALVVAALVAGGLVLRSIAKRISSTRATHPAQ